EEASVAVCRLVCQHVLEQTRLEIPVDRLAEVLGELGRRLRGFGCAAARRTGGSLANLVRRPVGETQHNCGEPLRHLRSLRQQREGATLVGVGGGKREMTFALKDSAGDAAVHRPVQKEASIVEAKAAALALDDEV